jgi:hypothetical protein
MENQWNNKKIAKFAGLLYLVFILSSVFADLFGHIGFGDTETIINTILSNEFLFRIGFIIGLFSALFFLLTAWALYILLKPVNKNIAFLFILLNLCGVIIQCLSILNLIGGMMVLQENQWQAILFIQLYKNGFNIAQIFYGAWVFPLGYLIYKSEFIPKIFGIFLMIDCFAILIYFLQFFLFSNYIIIAYICYSISAISEFSLTFWLLIKGIKNNKQNNGVRQYGT